MNNSRMANEFFMQETLDDQLILGNLYKYHQKLDSLDCIFVTDSIDLSSTTFA